jgi:hypothetical protein
MVMMPTGAVWGMLRVEEDVAGLAILTRFKEGLKD